MSIHIIEIGKHRFVCGLFWQSLSRPRELRKEAIDLAKKIDFDLMVLRRDHTTAQAGFAQVKDGVKKGMSSLAAAVSKSMAMEGAYFDGEKQAVHNWLAAFKLPDGKWAYFAVRDANFLPNGDFAGTKEEVLERLHGDYGLGGWNIVIGDAELENQGFHNFNAKRIEDVLPRKPNGQLRIHRWWGLQPIKPSIAWPLVAVGGLVLVVAATSGALYWQKYQKKKEEEARDRAIEEARRRMMGKSPTSALPHPWASKPLPLAFAQSCLAQFSHMTAGGWALDEYSCGGGQATYSWSRQGSTIQFLLEQVPDAMVDINGDKARFSVPLPASNGVDEALMEQKEAIAPLISKLQLLNVPARTNREAPPPSSSPNNPAPVPEWQTFPLTLSIGSMPPMEIAAILSQPGTRIDKMVYRGGAWSIEGVVYAK
jgi:hypothetical protein